MKVSVFLEEHGDLDFNIVHTRIESQNGDDVNISVLSTLRGSASVGSTFTSIDGGLICEFYSDFIQVREIVVNQQGERIVLAPLLQPLVDDGNAEVEACKSMVWAEDFRVRR